ncbi:MAG: hypothetical protein AAGM38_01165 [Pseudomonadota bacterium]
MPSASDQSGDSDERGGDAVSIVKNAQCKPTWFAATAARASFGRPLA